MLKTLTLATCALLLLGLGHTNGKLSSAKQLNQLKGQLQHAQQEAQKKLNDALAAHQALGQHYETTYLQQQEQNHVAQTEINRLTTQLNSRPVRVRIQTTSQPCSSSPTTAQNANANPSTTNPSPTYGLLPAANSQRLTSAIKQIETLNAAYTSCKTVLEQLTTHKKAAP